MRAAEYRKHAEEMMRCARVSRTDDEREQYVEMARAWKLLAAGAERGIDPSEDCEDAEK